MISLNTIYQFVDDKKRIRIVHIDQKNNACAYVHIEQNLSMPVIERISTIEQEYENHSIVEILDPYFKVKSEKTLSATEARKRDRFWGIVDKNWEARKGDIIEKKTRMRILREIAMSEKIPLMTIRRIFSRFWQRGMTKNALLPDYSNSGGKGKEKKVKGKKMGRPRLHGCGNSKGIIITDAIKRQFEVATNRYWRTKRRKTLRQVYRLMLADFYSIETCNNAAIRKIITDTDSIPTFHQYYYWFKKHENIKLDIQTRDGEKEFELKHRPLLSNSTLEVPGPGFRFQIDATIADIHIVSELDRSQIIGRPTIYIIMDVFSRMITGVYVGLESPSWNGAMMALDSMVADKVELCKRHGIEITSEDWPCTCIPEAIIADRGEMEGHGVENLVNNLKIKIENTAPYRGDCKGIVERFFRTINERIENFLPGAVMKDYRKRGDPDYRLEAKLTLKETNEIVLRSVLLQGLKPEDSMIFSPTLSETIS